MLQQHISRRHQQSQGVVSRSRLASPSTVLTIGSDSQDCAVSLTKEPPPPFHFYKRVLILN